MAKERGHKQYIKIILLIYPLLIFIISNPSILFAGTATLSWDPPKKNIDGTTTKDLGGYRVYYGTSSRKYTHNIDIGNATVYTVTGLANGLTYYFSITAYDKSNNESKFSNEVSKKIIHKCGDVNCDGVVDVVDALILTRYDAKFQVSNLTPEVGDVNCDGVVDVVDALIISRKDVGLAVSNWCCK